MHIFWAGYIVYILQVVRKMARTEEAEVDSNEDPLCIDLSSESKSQVQKVRVLDSCKNLNLAYFNFHVFFAVKKYIMEDAERKLNMTSFVI